MTLQGVIKDFNLSDDIYYILKKKDIRIPIKRYKNIEVCEYWYDDESRPDICCWIDVEGIFHFFIPKIIHPLMNLLIGHHPS